MKSIIAAMLLSIGLGVSAGEYIDLTIKQSLAVAEGVTALAVGPVVLPVALATGQAAALCKQLEGPWVKPSSYDPNSDGRDQCPKGNWLRILPYLSDLKPTN